MRTEDIRTLSEGTVLDAPICVVGAGPAGLTIAEELSAAGRQVLLLESGGRVQSPWSDALNVIESIGAPRVMDQTLVRNRVLGGSSATWWGRVATFDETDLRARPWVPESGWPILRSELEPYFRRAMPHLGLAIPDNTAGEALALLGADRARLDGDRLTRYLWSYSRDRAEARDAMRFGPRALELPLPGVACYTGATVTHIDTDAGGRVVRGLEVRGPDGRVRRVRTGRVVLCCGGIENARILLASNRVVPAGLGNGHDLVGRFLMDHLRGPIGAFRPADFPALQRLAGAFDARTPAGRTRVVPGWALSSRLQESERLLNCALWIDGEVADDDPLRSLAALTRLRNPGRNLAAAIRRAPLAARALLGIARRRPGVVRRMSTMTLQCIVEQRPDRDSRVTLSDRSDALGMPLTVLDWRVHDEEARTVRRAAREFAVEMGHRGLPVPDLLPMITDADERFELPDVAHPTGTTRMSAGPESGVVDPDCAVHGMEGLYVAGSSVFPTSGHANPTGMIVALAIRLADHLGRSWPAAAAVPAVLAPAARTEPVPDAAAPGDRPVVLLTGATGSVGRHVLPRLLEEGFAVRALTSRIPVPAIGHVDWQVHDLRQEDLDFRADVAGCAAVVHLAVEQREQDDMLRVNAEATGALARAAEATGVRFLCYTSSVSVYGSPAGPVSDEDSPVVTADRDVPTEHWARPPLRTYARTKLLGERALTAAASRVEYVVFRPTVVVDEARRDELASMPRRARAAAWTQRTHSIDVADVVEAVVWALQRALERAEPRPGVTVYNLSDERERETYGDVFRTARSGADHGGPPLPPIPAPAMRTLKWLQHGRRLPVRRPMGFASYPATRLQGHGFRYRPDVHRPGSGTAEDLGAPPETGAAEDRVQHGG